VAVVVRVRPVMGGTSRYGDAEETGTTREDIDGAFIAPSSSEDITGQGRHGVTDRWTLYAPWETDLIHTDRVEVDGVLYELDGDVARWTQPWSGWRPGVVATLKRVAG
jgi:hypothetical protein